MSHFEPLLKVGILYCSPALAPFTSAAGARIHHFLALTSSHFNVNHQSQALLLGLWMQDPHVILVLWGAGVSSAFVQIEKKKKKSK